MVLFIGRVPVPIAFYLDNSENLGRVGVTNGGLFDTAASCKAITSAHRIA